MIANPPGVLLDLRIELADDRGWNVWQHGHHPLRVVFIGLAALTVPHVAPVTLGDRARHRAVRETNDRD